MVDALTSVPFTLANYTGKGFAGDFGFKTLDELWELEREEFEFCGISKQQISEALETLVLEGKALKQGDGYSIPPAQCVRCGDDPCSCGIGTWRTNH